MATRCPFSADLGDGSLADSVRALLFDYRYITRPDLKSGRVDGRSTFFGGKTDLRSQQPIYAQIECINVNPQIQLQSTVGILHLPCSAVSRAMGLKLIDMERTEYDIVAHVSIQDGRDDERCDNPFTIDRAPPYQGMALLRNPYSEHFLTDVVPNLVLFKPAFKHARGSARQNALNPNILVKGTANKYDVFSFRPNRVHATPLPQGSKQLPEMFIGLPAGTTLGQVYFDEVRVCDVIMTSRFEVDNGAKAAFVHHFHDETLSDYFRAGNQAETLRYPYREKAEMIINYAARKLTGYGLEQLERNLNKLQRCLDSIRRNFKWLINHQR
jgi:hypothetical protein